MTGDPIKLLKQIEDIQHKLNYLMGLGYIEMSIEHGSLVIIVTEKTKETIYHNV